MAIAAACPIVGRVGWIARGRNDGHVWRRSSVILIRAGGICCPAIRIISQRRRSRWACGARTVAVGTAGPTQWTPVTSLRSTWKVGVGTRLGWRGNRSICTTTGGIVHLSGEASSGACSWRCWTWEEVAARSLLLLLLKVRLVMVIGLLLMAGALSPLEIGYRVGGSERDKRWPSA